jgi:hypothetical protein
MLTNSTCGRRCSLAFLAAFVASIATGCGGSSSIARVKGKVELDGQPLANGSIITIPKAGRGARGTIQNGEFELSTFGNNDGALVGTHKVAISASEPSAAAGPEAATGKLLVPERYTSPDGSHLTLEVEAGKVNTPTLKLTSP